MPDYESPYERYRLALVRSVVPPGQGLAVDIGCHEGLFTQVLTDKGYRAVGIDIDADALTRGRARHPGLDLRDGRAMDAGALAPRALTLCLEVIEHLTPPEQAELLRSTAASTPAGGRLVLSTPGRYSLMSVYERLRHRDRPYDWWDPTHIGVRSWRQLRRLILEAGFEIESLVGYHYLPLRASRPLTSRRRPWSRMGFDLIVTGVRRGTDARAPQRPPRPSTARRVRPMMRRSRARPWWRR